MLLRVTTSAALLLLPLPPLLALLLGAGESRAHRGIGWQGSTPEVGLGGQLRGTREQHTWQVPVPERAVDRGAGGGGGWESWDQYHEQHPFSPIIASSAPLMPRPSKEEVSRLLSCPPLPVGSLLPNFSLDSHLF